MFNYFLSPTPCALKVDGAFVGLIGENYSVLPYTEGFYELLPLSSRMAPLSFVLKNRSVSSPDIRFIDLYKGYLILPKFPERSDGGFRFVGKKFFSFSRTEVLLTCYREDGVRLVAESRDGLAVERVPFLPETFAFEKISGGEKEYLFCAFTEKKTFLVAFDVSDGMKVAFRMQCADYRLRGNTIETKEIAHDVVGHRRTTVREFGNKPASVSVTVTRSRPVYTLTEKLLPYAFFEEFLYGGDVSDYLSLRLRPRANELADFLGPFLSVLPPPHFVPDDCVLLLREKGVDFARAEIREGGIDNVTLIDKDDLTC